MRFGMMAAAAATCVGAVPANAVTLRFDQPQRDPLVYVEQGVTVLASEPGPFIFQGLHSTRPNVYSPPEYRIFVADRNIGVVGVTQSCCDIPDDPQDGTAAGGLAYYAANGTLLDRISFGSIQTPKTYRMNWTGGSYIIFGGDYVSIDNLVISGVPEPTTWALMILGFGAISGAMRRRRSVTAKVRFA